jgi:hypothetical protein
MSTRRQFVRWSSTALCALAALPKALLAQTIKQPVDSEIFAPGYLGAYTSGLLTQQHFAAVVGSSFRILHVGGAVTNLVLTSTISSAAAPSAPKPNPIRGAAPTFLLAEPQAAQNSFSVLFSSDAPVQQQTYVIDHGTLGRFAAFLVPGTGTGGQPTCTASFNYLTNAPEAPVTSPVHTVVTVSPLQTLIRD